MNAKSGRESCDVLARKESGGFTARIKWILLHVHYSDRFLCHLLHLPRELWYNIKTRALTEWMEDIVGLA